MAPRGYMSCTLHDGLLHEICAISCEGDDTGVITEHLAQRTFCAPCGYMSMDWHPLQQSCCCGSCTPACKIPVEDTIVSYDSVVGLQAMACIHVEKKTKQNMNNNNNIPPDIARIRQSICQSIEYATATS